MYCGVHVEVRGQLSGLVLPFHNVGSRDGTWVSSSQAWWQVLLPAEPRASNH